MRQPRADAALVAGVRLTHPERVLYPEQGVENGSLTRGEARKLRHQDAQIARERHRMARNGLSEHERKVLKRDLNRESDRIHDQRTDEQSR